MAAPKRNVPQREADMVIVSQLYIAGKMQSEIADYLTTLRPYKVGQAMVSYDICQIIDRWKRDVQKNITELKAIELAKINSVERKATEAWERSTTEAVKTVQEKVTGGRKTKAGDKQRAMVTKENQVGDPRFLEVILKCIGDRRKLMGLDAPVRTELSGPDGKPLELEVKETLTDEEIDRALRIVALEAQVIDVPKLRVIGNGEPGTAGNGSNGNGALKTACFPAKTGPENKVK